MTCLHEQNLIGMAVWIINQYERMKKALHDSIILLSWNRCPSVRRAWCYCLLEAVSGYIMVSFIILNRTFLLSSAAVSANAEIFNYLSWLFITNYSTVQMESFP